MRLLLDTNVWLDNYIPDRADHQLVGSLLTRAIKQQHDLPYALPSAKDVFYLITHAYKQMAREEGNLTEATASAINEIAWACIDNMVDLACAVGGVSARGGRRQNRAPRRPSRAHRPRRALLNRFA